MRCLIGRHCLIFCRLFNNAFTVMKTIYVVASNEWVLHKQCVGKVLEGSGRGQILRWTYYPGIPLKRLRKTTKILRTAGLRTEN
jgi:hypothetical protein